LQGFLEGVFRGNQEHRAGQPRFWPLRCILMPPYAIVDAVDAARQKYPEAKGKVLDAFTFFHLRRESLLKAEVRNP